MTIQSTNRLLFDLHVLENMDLVRSVIVKFDQVAEAMNLGVIEKQGSLDVPQDRTLWKYYQNISGQYHFTDTPMYVTSLDSGERILFSKENLVDHPVTRQLYMTDEFYSEDLRLRYPDQDLLTLGILNPVDVQTAVDAKEGTIISYYSHLVQEWETDLISELQVWLYAHVGRWINMAYTAMNDLYVASYCSQVYSLMLGKLMALRLRNCKSSKAHSFHVSEYLKSHNLTQSEINKLTRKQAMNLYRNIRYYQRYAGSGANLTKLIDVLLTERGMGIYEYDVVHNTRQISYTTPGDFSTILPNVSIARQALNAPAKQRDLSNLTLPEAYSMLAESAPLNPKYHADHGEEMERQIRRSKLAHLESKVLESTLDVTDTTFAQAPVKILMEQWIYLAAKGIYRRTFRYTPPGAASPIEVTQAQAVALWIYALHKAFEPDDTPEFIPTRVPQIDHHFNFVAQAPSYQSLLNLVLPEDRLRIDPQTYIDLLPAEPTSISNIRDFKDFCSSVYVAEDSMMRLYSYEYDFRLRAAGEMITKALHTGVRLSLPTMSVQQEPYIGVDYLDFLNLIGFSGLIYTRDDFYKLAEELFVKATGADAEEDTDPQAVQKAMISILKKLSSYSIEIVPTPYADLSTSDNRPDIRAVVRDSATAGNELVDFLSLRGDVIGENQWVILEDANAVDVGQTAKSYNGVNVTIPSDIVFDLKEQDPVLFPARYAIQDGLDTTGQVTFESLTGEQQIFMYTRHLELYSQ